MIHPRVTWTALVAGLVALAPLLSDYARSAEFAGWLSTLFGPVAGAHIIAACGTFAAVCLVIAAVGRSISPAIDAGTTPPASPAEGK